MTKKEKKAFEAACRDLARELKDSGEKTTIKEVSYLLSGWSF